VYSPVRYILFSLRCCIADSFGWRPCNLPWALGC
jgi:hypothetical protein